MLVNTPGIPFEWMVHALKLPRKRRQFARSLIDAADLVDAGRSNAETVVEGDGWKMILAVPPAYSGAMPLWSQLELRADPRPAHEIAAVLGVHRLKVWRWRTKAVFDPVTGVRLLPPRGQSLL